MLRGTVGCRECLALISHELKKNQVPLLVEFRQVWCLALLRLMVLRVAKIAFWCLEWCLMVSEVKFRAGFHIWHFKIPEYYRI